MITNKHNKSTLMDYYPILNCDGDMLISKSGDISICYEVMFPEYCRMSAEEYEQNLTNFISALSLLPENTILHKQDIFYRSRYDSSELPRHSYLGGCFAAHYHGREYLKHKSYIYITLTTKKRLESSTTASSILLNKATFNTFSEAQIADFFSCARSFGSYLQESLHIPCRQILSDEYPDMMHRHLTLEFDNTVTPLYEDMELLPSKMVIGEKHLVNYCISDSSQLSANLYARYANKSLSTSSSEIVSSLLGLINPSISSNHIINQYILLPNPKELIAKQETLSKLLGSFSGIGRANKVNKEIIDEFLNECAKSNLTPVKAHINILAWGNEAELPGIKQEIINSLTYANIRARHNCYDVPSKYFASLPGAAADLGIEDTFTLPLDAALCLLLYEGADRGDGSSSIYLTSRLDGIPVGIEMGERARDLSIIDNFNRFVLGPSGSGKSFLTNHILRQQYDAGDHIFIIDIGRSYYDLLSTIRHQSQGHDGSYYDYSEENQFSFNPFASTEGYTAHTLDFLKSLLLTMWLGDEDANNTHISDITKLLQHYESSVKDFRSQSFNTFYEFARDIYKEDFDNKKEFLKNLEKFYQGGVYDKYFNGDTSFEHLVNDRFIVFEIENIKDNQILYPLITLVIMELFVTKMLSRLITTQKVMLIEEAWKAIANRQMSNYIVWLWKTARKHNAVAMVVTQDIDDIISSPIVKDAIINNSSIKILLDQKNYINNFDKISQFLSLSPHDKALVLSVNRTTTGRIAKEVFVKRGNLSQVYSVEVSPQERVVYNTTKRDKEHLHSLMESYSIIESIEKIVNKS